MNKKLIVLGLLWLLTLVLTAYIAAGYNAGEILNSLTFKATDPYAEEICTFVDVGLFEDNVEFYFTCLNAKRISADQYEFQPNTVKIKIPLFAVQDCIAFYGSQGACWNNRLKDSVLNGDSYRGVTVQGIRFWVEQYREDINRTQSRAGTTTLNASQIPITSAEINF